MIIYKMTNVHIDVDVSDILEDDIVKRQFCYIFVSSMFLASSAGHGHRSKPLTPVVCKGPKSLHFPCRQNVVYAADGSAWMLRYWQTARVP